MIRRTAIFSPTRSHRYTLWRVIDRTDDLFISLTAEQVERGQQFLMVCGLNPSTADETNDDPTLTRCVNFARQWGFGALCMTNLFAFRETDPLKMKAARDPIGPENDRHLLRTAAEAGMILAAWGNHGAYLKRGMAVAGMLSRSGRPMYCLRRNGDGSPIHPLYMPADTIPQPYDGCTDSH